MLVFGLLVKQNK